MEKTQNNNFVIENLLSVSSVEAEWNRRIKLEGERKITSCVYLSYSLPKIFFLGVPLILSLVGLYCLIKHKHCRVNTLFRTS